MDDGGGTLRPSLGGRPPTIVKILSVLLWMLLYPVSASPPYTPSYIFISPQHNGSLAYMLLSDSVTQHRTQFLSLNISATVNETSPGTSILWEQAPFQSSYETTTFVPIADREGLVKVFAGNCHDALDEAVVWHFTPDNRSTIGNGTWNRVPILSAGGNANEGQGGPKFLATGFTFAAANSTPSSIYTFGGMCPFRNVSSQSYMFTANYSQSMLVLELSSASMSSYTWSILEERVSPIPEAGFTMTPLQTTYATTSSGLFMEQLSILMIGGQTQNAFLNMSQLALFSAPQNSWSFVNVDSSPNSNNTGSDIMFIEPRSGHSAVLSSDGSKVVVFGGWVGDIQVAAEPALAVLELGEDYGGSGPWTWKIPLTHVPGFMEGISLFGHGAEILPGDIMMVAGGYIIPPSTSQRSPAELKWNSNVYFFNMTSNEWTTSYKNPSFSPMSSSHPATGPLSSTSQKAGLGAGLGLGVVAVASVGCLIWLYSRRYRMRRSRDQELRKLALGAERSHFWDELGFSSSVRCQPREVKRLDHFEVIEKSTYSWTDPRNRDDSFFGGPLPARSSPQSLSSRPYRLLPHSSDFIRSDSAGNIHPIDEREEDEANVAESLLKSEAESACPGHSTYDTGNFLENPLGTGIEDAAQDARSETVQFCLDNLGHSFRTRSKRGRTSPDKSDRGSDLSDTSNSAVSARSSLAMNCRQIPLPSRPVSMASSGRQSPERRPTLSRHMSREISRASPDSALHSIQSYNSADSFTTARTKLSQLQAEGEQLLQTEPGWVVPQETPSTTQPNLRPKASEWIVGTVRRALNGSKKNANAETSQPSTAAMTFGIDRWSTVFQPRQPYGAEADCNSLVPRRAVSASSADLFRPKQGAEDWGAERGGKSTSRSKDALEDLHFLHRPNDDLALHGVDDFADCYGAELEDDGEDWDVEAAAERRRVQVTFTVPREKLRVVNATVYDMENNSEISFGKSNSETERYRKVSN